MIKRHCLFLRPRESFRSESIVLPRSWAERPSEARKALGFIRFSSTWSIARTAQEQFFTHISWILPRVGADKKRSSVLSRSCIVKFNRWFEKTLRSNVRNLRHTHPTASSAILLLRLQLSHRFRQEVMSDTSYGDENETLQGGLTSWPDCDR